MITEIRKSRLRRLRNQGFNITQCARKCKMDPKTASRILKGEDGVEHERAGHCGLGCMCTAAQAHGGRQHRCDGAAEAAGGFQIRSSIRASARGRWGCRTGSS